MAGTVLGPSQSLVASPSSKPQHRHPFNNCKDGLMLTAAALWSLFNNSVERLPYCKCTFKSGAGDFIQCKRKVDNWFLWHTFSGEQECRGEQCKSNVCVALVDTDPGEYVTRTSPCVLGWAAYARTSADSALWETLRVTSKFKRREFRKYDIRSVQTQAFLTAPVVPTPQVGATVTFSMRNYKIANSLDHGSILAMETAAAAVVLMFDEKRELHITCDGADIIEVLCLEKLRGLGLRPLDRKHFSHNTGLLRIPTWGHLNFVTSTGLCIPGEHLVRAASKTLSQVLELSRRACTAD
jgi:hypothetical protein